MSVEMSVVQDLKIKKLQIIDLEKTIARCTNELGDPTSVKTFFSPEMITEAPQEIKLL